MSVQVIIKSKTTKKKPAGQRIMLKRLSKPKVKKPTLRLSDNVMTEGKSNPTQMSTQHRVYSPDNGMEFKTQVRAEFGNYQSNMVSPMVQTQYGWRNAEVA